jgi:uncharacterized membrane protein YdjX (TVP38/TMEM64 family)
MATEPPIEENRRRARASWPRWALAAGLLLAVGGFYSLGWQQYFSWDYVRANLDRIQEWTRDNLALAVLVYFGAYTAITALSLPVAAVISILAGALFGRWLGTGVVSLAATLGAALAFLSSRYILRDFVRRRFGKRLAALNRGVENDGAYYLLTLRLVPAFPFFLINLGMGLTPMPLRTYTWVSLVGMLPGTFVYVNAGTALGSLDSPADVLTPGVLLSLALLAIAPLAMGILVRWKRRTQA